MDSISPINYRHSKRSKRNLESIRDKTLGDYQPDELLFINEEIKKHQAVIDLYEEQRRINTDSKELLTMLIPVRLTLDNYQDLHWNNAVGKLSKFKVLGTDEIVYAPDVIHKVDIDFPLGFFHAGGKIVESIIIPKSVTVGEFDSIVRKIKDSGNIDINSNTEIFEKTIDYITQLFNTLY